MYNRRYSYTRPAKLAKSAALRADFMSRVSARVEELNPSKAGRIDWDTANHLYNTGKNVEQTAQALAG